MTDARNAIAELTQMVRVLVGHLELASVLPEATGKAYAPSMDSDFLNEARALTAKYETDVESEADKWQPIANAPKQRVILLYALTDMGTGNYKMDTGFWSEGHGGWVWEGRALKPYETQPTRWMSLPSPPSPSASHRYAPATLAPL